MLHVPQATEGGTLVINPQLEDCPQLNLVHCVDGANLDDERLGEGFVFESKFSAHSRVCLLSVY